MSFKKSPPILDRNRSEDLFGQLCLEHRPLGPTEMAIVRDMARQAAAMERWGIAAEAVERFAAQSLPSLGAVLGSEAVSEDAVLSAAMGTDAAERCERLSLGHTRAFYRALHKLQELQAGRRHLRPHHRPIEPPTLGPADEAACGRFLADRFLRGECPCPRCGDRQGYFIPTRKSWECANCQAQTGLRSGTVMACSPLPLKTWFSAISWLLSEPAIGTAELAKKLCIRRHLTVRKMARKIREALAADNATSLLAGLDQLVPTLSEPELSVRHEKKELAETLEKSRSLAILPLR